MAIRYERFSPLESRKKLASLIECYQQVFSGEPWNEWRKCEVCGMKWGESERDALEKLDFEHCGAKVDPYWTMEKVRSDIEKEISRDASCWIAIDYSLVVGFCWGYPISPDRLENILSLPGTADAVRRHFGNQISLAYQDEIGVRKEYRGQGIAKKMFAMRLGDFTEKKLKIGILRTKENPPSITYSWYKKMEYGQIHRYPDIDGRIILARALEGLRP